MRSGTHVPVRRLVAAALAASVAMTLGACGRSGPAPAASSGDRRIIRIAYSLDNNDSSQQTILDATKARVDKLNATRTDVQIIFDVYDARASVDKQMSDVQTAIQKKPDVMIFSPVDNVGSLPAAQAAKDAGVLLIDKRPTDPEPPVYNVAFYANDENKWSGATVDWIKSKLAADPKLVLKTGVIYGQPAQTAQLIRIDAIKKLAQQMPDRVQIVAEAYGNWLTDKAQSITEDWLQAHPEINYIAAANDIMATGVSNAVVTAGKKSSILISGYDTVDDGLLRIKAGTQDFDTGVPFDGYAEVIDVAVDLALGKFTANIYKVGQINVVTSATVDTYLKSRGLSK